MIVGDFRIFIIHVAVTLMQYFTNKIVFAEMLFLIYFRVQHVWPCAVLVMVKGYINVFSRSDDPTCVYRVDRVFDFASTRDCVQSLDRLVKTSFNVNNSASGIDIST